VYKNATSGKTKILSEKKAKAIIEKIKDGSININEYDKKTKTFIENYKQWYDKALDCASAVDELKQSLKELQQTKLDNITEHFESIVGKAEAIKASSEAAVDYYTTVGRAVNTVDREEL